MGETIVGFVGVDAKYLSWLYVDPAWYGRGIGRRLLRLGIGLIGPGAWTISLAGNTRARRLYESEGFQIVRSFDGSNAGYPCSCVEFALAPSATHTAGTGEDSSWQTVASRIVPGHRVASGLKGDPRFPGGTLRMQAPVFLALGFDLTAYHSGTLNVSIAPRTYCVVKAPITFRDVKWHPTEPAEDFSFFDVRVIRPGGPPIAGKIYYPHPETKPEHFQRPDVLELLLPYIEGVSTGAELRLQIPASQMLIE